MAIVASVTPGPRELLTRLDWLLYDAFYNLRTNESRLNGPVVVIAADDDDLNVVESGMGGAIPAYRWPWPRQFWGEAAKYLQANGARAVVFDLQFDQPSGYNDELDDDAMFAATIDGLNVPTVFAVTLQNGKIDPLAPPISNPRLGVASRSDKVVRSYGRFVEEKPSLAEATLMAIQQPVASEPEFLLHFAGPVVRPDKTNTLRYVSAAKVLAASLKPENAELVGLDPSIFKDKIVIIGATAANTYDLYTSPLDKLYPGVDSHATAIDNLLSNQRVHEARWASILLVIGGALLTTLAAIVPRSTTLKLLFGASGILLIASIGVVFFTRQTIVWIPLAAPLLAGVLGVVGGFAQSFLSEDKARRHMTKALESYVSPQVTRLLERDPSRLSLQAEQRDMTVMFTDLAGFTDFSEVVPVRVLSHVLNVYMDTMTRVLLDHGATVDKYVGDQIMAFWNAPIDQPDHADLAAASALAIQRADALIGDRLIIDPKLVDFLKDRPDIRQTLDDMGKTKLFTRIGINSGVMNVGNMGSSLKFQYTAIGDAVNAAARLEPANKRYGTRILVSGEFVKLLKKPCFTKRLDVLRVKGKKQATEVFTLIDTHDDSPKTRELARAYEAAFVHYQHGDFLSSRDGLIALLSEFGDDAASKNLLARVEHFIASPPSAWDGVYTMTDK